MSTYTTSGVYREDVFPAPPAGLQTGVPAFLGYTDGTAATPVNTPLRLTLQTQFEAHTPGYLADAVRGFFANGGRVCYVLRLDASLSAREALRQGLRALETLEQIDLVAAPDIMRPRTPVSAAPEPAAVQAMQAALLHYCDTLADRMALLDPMPALSVDEVLAQRQALRGENGALYYPWLGVGDDTATVRHVPPCGHVAGLYARQDARSGFYTAPANRELEEVLDLEEALHERQQGRLNSAGINCLVAFPGRGIRVWGTRTISDAADWRYVNVRRLFLTVGRWVERTMAGMVFEPNNFTLWVRIERELRTYLQELFQRGALQGRTAREAFYVRCNAETNPPEVRDAGMVVTEVGLAPAIPSEFVVVRLIHGASGVALAEPERASSF